MGNAPLRLCALIGSSLGVDVAARCIAAYPRVRKCRRGRRGSQRGPRRSSQSAQPSHLDAVRAASRMFAHNWRSFSRAHERSRTVQRFDRVRKVPGGGAWPHIHKRFHSSRDISWWPRAVYKCSIYYVRCASVPSTHLLCGCGHRCTGPTDDRCANRAPVKSWARMVAATMAVNNVIITTDEQAQVHYKPCIP